MHDKASAVLGFALFWLTPTLGSTVGYFVGGPGAECFKYPQNVHLQPCAELDNGDLQLTWLVAPPATLIAGVPFVASWNVTASAQFIASQGNFIRHTNLHACQGLGGESFGFSNCNPFGADSSNFISTRNPQIQATLTAGVPITFNQTFRGGLRYVTNKYGVQDSIVLAHVIAGGLSVALPAFVTTAKGAAGTDEAESDNVGIVVAASVAGAVLLLVLGAALRRRSRKTAAIEDAQSGLPSAGGGSKVSPSWARDDENDGSFSRPRSAKSGLTLKGGESKSSASANALAHGHWGPAKLTGTDNEKGTRVFISYGHGAATSFSMWLRDRLAEQGFTVWIDEQDIDVAVDWQEAIGQAIVECDALIAVLDAKYVSSEFCRRELSMATNRRKLLYPLVYRDFKFDTLPPGFEYQLSNTQTIAFTEPANDSANFKKLVGKMRDHMMAVPVVEQNEHVQSACKENRRASQ